MCVCVLVCCVAVVVSFEELEQSGGHASWLHGLPHLRRGQGSTAQVHPQTWQVGATHKTVILCVLGESKRGGGPSRPAAALQHVVSRV